MSAAPAKEPAKEPAIEVHGLIVRTRVSMTFENPGDYWTEAIYVYPLPEDAVVDRLRMTVGERIIEGRIDSRDAARAAYEDALEGGRQASLVEQELHNIFTTAVANIGPGESITVAIEYQEVVDFDSGEFRLRFPMVVGPRYIPDSGIQGGEELRVFDTGYALKGRRKLSGER